jgi:hypothetical protein
MGYNSLSTKYTRSITVAQRLKRWESPRSEGRNDKGKGGSARQRQLRKQQQMLRKKLKQNNREQQQRGREINLFPLIFSSVGRKIYSSSVGALLQLSVISTTPIWLTVKRKPVA